MTIDDLLTIDPDSYVKGVEEGKRNATPSIEKQSELITQIDKLIENMKKQLHCMEQLRTTLLVQWLVKGDEKEFQRVMMAENWGDSFFKYARQRAQYYFRTVIEPWQNRTYLMHKG